MTFWLLAAAAIGLSIAQDALPGEAVYHDGWYGALIVVLIVLAFRAGARNRVRRLTLAGTLLIAIAGAAASLLGPDTQTIVGAPGASIETADFGTIHFPLDPSAVPPRQYRFSEVLSAKPRAVISVTAADSRGGHLTVTQPSGATFLSPVLLLQQPAHLAGMDVRTDQFALPAISRMVRVVYFTPAQAALLHAPGIVPGRAAILFDMSDARGRSVPHGIAIAADGAAVTLAGVRLRAQVMTYPAIEAASAPFLPFVAGGLLIAIAGLAKNPSRSKT